MTEKFVTIMLLQNLPLSNTGYNLLPICSGDHQKVTKNRPRQAYKLCKTGENQARVVKLADTLASGASAGDGIGVQVPSRALFSEFVYLSELYT